MWLYAASDSCSAPSPYMTQLLLAQCEGYQKDFDKLIEESDVR